MQSEILGLLAESPIHAGSGRSLGVVDLPVAREAGTDYPVIAGSSLKGAIRDKAAGGFSTEDQNRYFGSPDGAGGMLISDARIALLPIRSLTGAYRWATCPHLLERLQRDLARAGIYRGSVDQPSAILISPPASGRVLSAGSEQDVLYLEERQFEVEGEVTSELIGLLAPLIRHPDTAKRLGSQLTVLSDDDFAWFVRYGLPVQARNMLDHQTKQSQNLWYEESLPPDTVMYALLTGRKDGDLEALDLLFDDEDPYLQAGGNETVGHGWFATTRVQRRSS